MARQVFYSFHYDNDVFRVQQIRNMGAIDGNSPASANEWEEVKRGGDDTIKRWINGTMAYRSCVIVLIGSETANRKWINYEIEKAWNDNKGLFGIYVHNLKDPKAGTCRKGENPFEKFTLSNGKLSDVVKCYDPNSLDAYNDIKKNIADWIEKAVKQRQ